MQKASNATRRAGAARLARNLANPNATFNARSGRTGAGNMDAQCLFATYRLNRKAVKVEMTFDNVREHDQLNLNRKLQEMYHRG
jgi:hypothetical protein